MLLTNLGFLFLLLPVSAAAYCFVPSRKKPLALLLLSAFFLLLIDRYTLLILCITLLPDCAALFRGRLHTGNARLVILCIAQHVAALLLFGLVLPPLGLPSMTGLIIFSLAAIDLLVAIRRGMIPPAPIDYLAAVLFFGRSPLGPCGSGGRILSALQKVRSTLPGIGHGIMLLIAGIAKQIILSEEFFALFRTLSHLAPDRVAAATCWIYALCGALGLFFLLSGFSDIAQGLGMIFGIPLPRITYYPLQAASLREYCHRFHMPLEDTLYRLIPYRIRQRLPGRRAVVVSITSMLLLAILIAPDGFALPWSLTLSALLLLDALVLQRIPFFSVLLARCVTFFLALPTYLLLLPVELPIRIELIGLMFGAGSPELFNNTTFYLLRSNAVLLLIGLLFSSSLIDRLSRLTRQQFPSFWWILSAGGHLILLVVTTSFLLWNVR